MLDWSQCPWVERRPDRMGGVWTLKDSRFPVSTIFENLTDMSVAELLATFPDLTREQVDGVLAFVAESLKDFEPVRG